MTVENTNPTDGEDPNEELPKDNNPAGENPNHDPDKYVALDRHLKKTSKLTQERDEALAKVAEYESAQKELERQNMTELEKANSQIAELQSELSDYKNKELRSNAFLKARKALGDDLEIPAEHEETIHGLLAKINPSDTFESDVETLVKGFAKPKDSGTSTLVGAKAKPKGEEKPPLSYTGNELGKLLKEDREKYDRVMAARKKALNTKPKDNDGK